jgi:hypothetical protein
MASDREPAARGVAPRPHHESGFAFAGGEFGDSAFAALVLDDLVADDVEFGGQNNVAPVNVSSGDKFAEAIEITGGEFEEIEVNTLVDGGCRSPVNGLDQFADGSMFGSGECRAN